MAFAVRCSNLSSAIVNYACLLLGNACLLLGNFAKFPIVRIWRGIDEVAKVQLFSNLPLAHCPSAFSNLLEFGTHSQK